ncbi:MAG: RNA methyltransferase [Thermoanaerobaculia bacterium]
MTLARRIRIVLVEPREEGNVGAVARAMKNFGLDDLVVVGQIPGPGRVAEWWSSGAADLVGSARVVATLDDAIQDVHRTIATTSARGRSEDDLLTPKGLSELWRDTGAGERIALVFGREDRGLTAEEVAKCQFRVSIPTSTAFPTMNLAQSVAILCYELHREDPPRGAAKPAAAEAGQIERLHEMARELLLDSGFLNAENPDHIYDEMRALAGRARLSEREVTLLLGAVRQLRWKIHGSEASDQPDSA